MVLSKKETKIFQKAYDKAYEKKYEKIYGKLIAKGEDPKEARDIAHNEAKDIAEAKAEEAVSEYRIRTVIKKA